jgi:Lrp/AsnC family transcriptional regulator
MGLGMLVFVMVILSAHGRQYLEDFERAVRELPQVLECFTITGTSDYMLKIIARDTQDYEQFMRHQLSLLQGVHEFHSFVALTEIKYSTALPVAAN